MNSLPIHYDPWSYVISIGKEFIKSLIEYEYGITAKPITSLNPVTNSVLEQIRQVLGNLVRTFKFSQTYVDENDPWAVILAAASFAIISTTNRLESYSPGKLVFGRDMILPIKYEVNWGLIHQQNMAQIHKDNIRKNRHRVDYDYKVGDDVMLNNTTA